MRLSKRFKFFLKVEIRESGRWMLVLNACIVVGILKPFTGHPPVFTGKDLTFWVSGVIPLFFCMKLCHNQNRGDDLEVLITELIQQYTYLAVFLLIAIENLFPPIPSEIILSFAGFLSTAHDLNIYFMIFCSVMGSYVGAVLLYYLGWKLPKKKLFAILMKFHMKEEDLNKSMNWFYEKGKISVFIGRFVPIIRSLISIPAGMVHMKFLPFSVYTISGSLIWNSILILIGGLLGENYQKISVIVKNYGMIILILFFLILFIIKRKKKKRTTFPSSTN